MGKMGKTRKQVALVFALVVVAGVRAAVAVACPVGAVFRVRRRFALQMSVRRDFCRRRRTDRREPAPGTARLERPPGLGVLRRAAVAIIHAPRFRVGEVAVFWVVRWARAFSFLRR